jgi:hypothetical protein
MLDSCKVANSLPMYQISRKHSCSSIKTGLKLLELQRPGDLLDAYSYFGGSDIVMNVKQRTNRFENVSRN